MPSERRQIAAGRSFGAFRRISRGIVVEKNGAGQVGTRQADREVQDAKFIFKNIDIIYIVITYFTNKLKYR
ncbi:TPA: hypothetical protein ACKMRK_001552 [Neisseria gonorrhoeae]